MPVRTKICCIQDEDELHVAIRAGAHLVGFVGRGCSGPEVIDDDGRIAQLAHTVPPGVGATLLVRGTDPDEIAQRAQRTHASVLQLIDPLTEEAHRALRRAVPTVRVLSVIHVQGPEAVFQARDQARWADALLLDSGSPADGVFGGTGRTHDWSISAEIVASVPVPVWLAGGLGPHNLAEAWDQVHPFGMDVCSGLRTDGRLDPTKVAAFGAVARTLG